MSYQSNNQLTEVVEWGELSSEQRSGVLAKKIPIVLRGYVKSWPMVGSFDESFDQLCRYLLQYDSSLPFQAMIAHPKEKGRLFYEEDLTTYNFDRMNGYFSDALTILRSLRGKANPPAFYMGSKSIPEYFPGLEDDCCLPCVSSDVEPNIWIGNSAVVAAHNDNAENIACVGAGRRRFTLFPPDQEENLYIGRQSNTPGNRPISMVDFNRPDLNRFPRFSEALESGQVANLAAGDALYIPTHWWHHVESIGDINILVNFWWQGSAPSFN